MITKYQDYLIRDFDTAENGNKAVGVNVWIYEAGTSVLAALKDEYNNPIANPVTTDKNGYYSFYINPNYYDFKTDVGTDRERFLFENVNIDFTDAFDIVVIKNPTSNVLPIPYKITKEQVELNGNVLPPDSGFYEVDNDALTITISSDLNSDDIVVLRFSPLSNVDAPSGYGGVLDNQVADPSADISPIVKQMYENGFKTIYIYNDYFIDRAVFDSSYSGLKLVCYGKLSVIPTATEGGDGSAARSVWFFEGDGYEFYGLNIDVTNKRGLTGMLMQNCTNFKVINCKFGNGGTSDEHPNLVSGLNIKSGKRGEVTGNTFYNYLPTGSASQSRGLSVDSVDGDPCEDIKFSLNSYINNNANCVVGYAKDCHWNNDYHLNTLDGDVSTRNSMYFVAYDAPFQGGGCTVTNTEFVNCLQPFVTRVSYVTFKDNIMTDCSICVGIDNSATPAQPITDVTIEGNEMRMTDDSDVTAGAFMRTRLNHVLAKNITVRNNKVRTNLQFGSFLAFDSGFGRVDDSLFEGNEVTCMLKDEILQGLKFPVVFNEGANNTFKNNTFKVENLTGGTLSESTICTIRLPVEGGNDWIDNSMSSDDPDLYIRANNVFAGDSHVQDNVNILLGDFSGGVLQSKKYESVSGRTVSAISGIFPRSGVWNSGDMVKRDALVMRPLNYFPSNADEYWLCIKSGDFSDADPANWPVWCANGEYDKQRVTIAPPTLISPASATKGVDVLVQIDTTINKYPDVPIKSVLYELYENVAGSFNLVESRNSTNDRELFTGLSDGGEYRINVIGRSAFYIDQGVAVGYDFTVSSSEPSDTLGTPVNITTNDAALESNYDARVKGLRVVEVDDYTIDTLNYSDSDLEKTLVLSSLTGGTFRLSGDASSSSKISGINLSGTWTIIPSTGTTITGSSTIPQGFGFDILKGIGTWYVQIYTLDYTEPANGTFQDGNAKTVSVTDGKITNFGV